MNIKENSFDAPLVAIVDDDLSVRRSSRRLLSSVGLRAEAFGSAEEFLSSGLVAQTACLILDQCMPGMNGLELQRHLADEGRRIPIIFITAQENEALCKEATQAGALYFLQKPVSKNVLLFAIRDALKIPPQAERSIL